MLSAAWEPRQRATVSLISTNLVIFFVFALAALYFLTRSLVSTAQINDDVDAAINPATSGISHDTSLLTALNETDRITGRISRSLAPLSGQLGQSMNATNSIRESMYNTNASVANIETSVAGINGSVSGIFQLSGPLGSGVGQIYGAARDIESRLAQTRSATISMNADLAASNQNLRSILSLIAPITAQTGRVSGTLGVTNQHTANIENNGLIKLGNLGHKQQATSAGTGLNLSSLLGLLGRNGGTS